MMIPAEQMDKARTRAVTYFLSVISDTYENISLREAEAANNRVHGYVEDWNDLTYVNTRDRNEDWRAVDRTIMGVWETRTDRVEENLWMLSLALYQLTPDQRKRVQDILRENMEGL